MHKHDVDNLLANPAWQEIADILTETRRGLVEDLCELDPVGEGGKIARQQGRLKMVDFMLSLPDSFIEEMKLEEMERMKDKKEEEKEDE